MRHFYIIRFLLTLILCWSACAALDTDSVIVELETEDSAIPLYFGGLENKGTPFPPDYIRKLEDVLRFDLNYSSQTKTEARKPDLDALSNDAEISKAEHLPTWRALNISYVANASIGPDNKLKAKLILINSKNIKSIEGIQLTGSLDADRKRIHRLADAIHKAIFGTNGIASTKLIYTTKHRLSKDSEVAEVWMSDYDGGNTRQITEEKALCVTPTFFPPKTGNASGAVFFVSYAAGVPKIHSSNIGSATSRRAIQLRGNQLMPAISRQRDAIAFITDAPGNPDLFIAPMNPENGTIGKPRQIFTARNATQGTPTFHPDGSRIAFVSNKDGRPRIYMMPIPKEGERTGAIKPTLVTKLNRSSTSPQWSPDSTKIVYQARISGIRQICVYDLDTGKETQLTHGSLNKENPSWAPDSKHIVYNSGGQIYLISTHHPEPVAITSGPGEKRFPAWEPL